MAWSALIAAYFAGLLGGVHCLAMCGGFAMAVGAASAPARLQPARVLALSALASNAGRVITYALLGALVGGVGSGLLLAARWLPVQRALYVVANLMLVAVAVSLVSRREGQGFLQRVTGRAFVALGPAIGALSRRSGWAARVAVGTLWGLVPCAMIYTVLPLALFAGGAAQGALVMLAFGLGTLPNLLAAGWIASRARRWLDAAAVRIAAASVLATFAAIGVARAVGDSTSLATNPFCFMP